MIDFVVTDTRVYITPLHEYVFVCVPQSDCISTKIRDLVTITFLGVRSPHHTQKCWLKAEHFKRAAIAFLQADT